MKIYIKNLSLGLEKYLSQTKGQKRLFLFFGIINMVITNLFLQLFLSKSFISTSTATLAAQMLNMFLGYFIYSKLVFKNHNIFIKKFFIKYLLLMSTIWLTNFSCIELLKFAGFARNISALTLVPILAFVSFIVQKYYIFKN